MFNSSSPGLNGCHFVDDIFKCIFLNEKFDIFIRISLKFVPKGTINSFNRCGAPSGLSRTSREVMITVQGVIYFLNIKRNSL